jgi:hypothetical protein
MVGLIRSLRRARSRASVRPSSAPASLLYPATVRRKNGREFPDLRHGTPSPHARLARLLLGLDRLFSFDDHCSHQGLAAEPWPRTIRSRLSRYEIIEKVLPSLTAVRLKNPGYGDAIGLVRTDAKAKAALAIMAEFDKALGRRKDGPAHPDHLDEAARRIP